MSTRPDLPAAGVDPSPFEERQESSTLELVVGLCEALAVERIRYCHWKSTEALDRSASGENDLDLLVSRHDAQRFDRILRDLGFKDTVPSENKRVPGVFHSYGLDHSSKRFVHVHAQYQLVLGDDMTKNYRLPIEEAYLGSAEEGALFRVPSPEFEFVVFVLRMVLKHSTWDSLLFHQGGLSRSEKREFSDLTHRADLKRTHEIVRQHLPFIAPALWKNCALSLQPEMSRWFRIKTAQRLERSLRESSRRTHVADVSIRSWRRSRTLLTRHLLHRRPVRQRLVNGGALIAVVGGDGAGKSSAIDEIYRWLSKDLDTIKVHLGKPPRSPLSTTVRGLLRLEMLRHRASNPRALGPVEPDDEPSPGPGLPGLIRGVVTSRDRYLTYVAARRFATDGGIVVSDRFPLSQITLMDGPAASRMPDSWEPNKVARFLIGVERGYYSRILDPDILIVLRVHPDIAVQRKPREGREQVRRRSTEVWGVDWRETPAIVIDAGRSKAEVLSEIKSVIWSAL